MSKFALDFSKLLGQIEAGSTNKKTYEDNSAEFWKPTKDKAGNASALIRFLPSKNIEDFPFVRKYKHNFKDKTTNRWYIENSLTTIGEQDYISEVNVQLWETDIKENKDLASLRKRKLSYISNILVIKDTGNPENNGKVFKYEYGKKIWEKIAAASKGNPDLGEEPVIVFDPIEGANFLLKMQKVDDQFNYDQSKFAAKTALFDGDEDAIEEVLSRCYDIQLEIAPDKFKTYEELKDKFLWVTGQKTNSRSGSSATAPKESAKAPEHNFDEDDDELSKLSEMAKESPKKETAKPAARKTPPPIVDNDDSDEDFFKSLVN